MNESSREINFFKNYFLVKDRRLLSPVPRVPLAAGHLMNGPVIGSCSVSRTTASFFSSFLLSRKTSFVDFFKVPLF
jgi:hypothetical protein